MNNSLSVEGVDCNSCPSHLPPLVCNISAINDLHEARSTPLLLLLSINLACLELSIRMSHAHSLALAFNLPKLLSSSLPFFFRLRLDSPCNKNAQSALSSPNVPSLHSTSKLNSSPLSFPPLPPTVSPSFGRTQAPSSTSQGSHSLSTVRKKKMQRRQCMRCWRGGGGRGEGGQSGLWPPLLAGDDEANQPSASNVSSFIFCSELNRP